MKTKDAVGKVALAGAAVTVGAAGAANADPADFAGLYAGLGFAAFNGSHGYEDYSIYATPPTIGVFGGYNHVMGNMVVGIELAFHANAINAPDDYYEYGLERLADLKLRAGPTVNNLWIYGILGTSSAFQCSYQCSDTGYSTDVTGLAYGIGMETNVTDKFFVGAEILARDFEEEDKIGEYGPTMSLTIRGGFRF